MGNICNHRFLDFHKNGLFPDWNVKYLFIGTFNPEWNNENNNADYFYGRSNYFWSILPTFFHQESLKDSGVNDKIKFSKNEGIGFTDIIKGIKDLDRNNKEHVEKVLSFKDNELITFGSKLIFNTAEIKEYIIKNPSLEKIYFTLLGQNLGLISQSMLDIENYSKKNRPDIHLYRLHTHTGQGLKRGKPRENKLINFWYHQGLKHLNPEFDLKEFPYTENY